MNFNIVIDTQAFKPFDISPALNILRDYRDAYYKYDEQLNKIAEENGQYVLPDTPEYKKYKDTMDAYNKDFYNVASDFSRGMNIRNAQAVRDIQKRYYNEMAPIKRMIESYNKYNDKITALGPDAIIGNAHTIDDFYGGINPSIDYRSAKQVEADALKYFTGVDNALTQDPKFREILGGQYYLQTQKGGLDSGAALKAALVEYNNRTNGQYSKEIQDLLGHMENVMNSQGVQNFSQEAKEKVWSRIAAGLVDSISAPKYSETPNRDHESPSDRRRQAYNDAQMLQKGYVYNEKTGNYEYDEDTAATQGGAVKEATLPDGTQWVYNPTTKQWTSTSDNWDGVPRTSAQLVQETRRQIAEKQKKEEEIKKQEKETAQQEGTVGKRTEEQYLALGEKFQPLNYKGWSNSSNWSYKEDDGDWLNGYSYSAWYGNNSKLSDAEKDNIRPEVKADIINRAKQQIPNIGWEDLDIYLDHDAFSNNHYRVVIKGTGERGLYKEPETGGTGSTERKSVPIVPVDSISKPQGL